MRASRLAWLLCTGLLGCGDDTRLDEPYPFPFEPDQLSRVIPLADAAGSPMRPVHATLLKEGSVLLLGKDGNAGLVTPQQIAVTPDTFLLGAAVPALEPQPPSPPYLVWDSLFCSGHTQLANGAFFSVGGSRFHSHSLELDHGQPGPDFLTGLDYGTVFDGTWHRTTARLSTSGPTNTTRWYPQATRLADGRILVTGGWDLPVFTTPHDGSFAGTHNSTAEIYDPKAGPETGTFTPLTTLADTPSAIFNHDYTHVFVLPSGEDDGLALGESSAPIMFKLDRPQVWSVRPVVRPDNASELDDASVTPPNDQASSAMLPLRLRDGEWGYHNGSVMVAGGLGTWNERSIDIYDPVTNAWNRPRLDMVGRRWHPATVLLPDGRILVIGGHNHTTTHGEPTLRKALLLDPAEGFQIAQGDSTMDELRGYHAVAVLLPDGRVFYGGGRSGGRDDAEDERADFRFYSPPYLASDRAAQRPVITSAPGDLPYGMPATLGITGEASEAVLLALGSMTHAFDSNQRYIQLAITPAQGGATVIGPPDARTAPPGYYMLFVLDAQRTPSVAQIVRVCGDCSAH